MDLNISFFVTTRFLPIGIMMTLLSLTVSQSIMYMPTSIFIQPLIVWTKTSSLDCQLVQFFIIQLLILCFFSVSFTNTDNTHTLEPTTYHILRQYIKLFHHFGHIHILVSILILLDPIFHCPESERRHLVVISVPCSVNFGHAIKELRRYLITLYHYIFGNNLINSSIFQ